jgi:hypothetical protein
MVKLKVALASLTKSQLLQISENCRSISISTSLTKTDFISKLEKQLISTQRMQRLIEEFDTMDIALVKMFLKEKKLRYSGMSQEQFTKFLTLNKRMKYDFITSVNKMREIGLIFTKVPVKKKNKVVFPSEYLRYFNDYFKENGMH